MLKKYLPYILLFIAALLLWYIKSHQRGNNTNKPERQQTETVKINPSTEPVAANDPIDRTPEHLIYTEHARCRMECRHIDESEVKEILENGKVNRNKIENNERGRTYPLEGVTHDRQHVRIVFAPKDDGTVVVVTCIDLDTDWQCDCK